MNPFQAHAASSWSNECQVDGVATIAGIKCIITNLLGIMAPFLIIVAVGMVIFSGIRMIISADNPKELETAKKSLTFAIVGVVGIAAAWMILVLIQNFTGAQVTEINFGTTPTE